MKEIELRKAILSFLMENGYRVGNITKGSRKGFLDDIGVLSAHFNVDQQAIADAISFLYQEGYINGTELSSGRFVTVQITSMGIKLIEGESEFNRSSSFVDQSIRVHGDISGSTLVSGNNNAVVATTDVKLTKVVSDAVAEMKKSLHDQNLSENDRVEIEKSIDKLATEVSKAEPSADVVEARTEGLLDKLSAKGVKLEKIVGSLKALVSIAPYAYDRVQPLLSSFL